MAQEPQVPEMDIFKLASSLLPIGLMMGYNKLGLDNEDPKVLWGLRAFYAISQLIYFGILFYLEYLVNKNKNERVIVYVEKIPATELQQLKKSSPDHEPYRYAKKHIYEYDLEQIAAMRSYMGIVITVGLHAYFGFVQPLFIQSFTGLLRIFENKIVRNLLFGTEIERPLPPDAASPFASLLGSKSEKELMDEWDQKHAATKPSLAIQDKKSD